VQDYYSLSRVYCVLGWEKGRDINAAQTAKLDSQPQRSNTFARQFTAEVLPNVPNLRRGMVMLASSFLFRVTDE